MDWHGWFRDLTSMFKNKFWKVTNMLFKQLSSWCWLVMRWLFWIIRVGFLSMVIVFKISVYLCIIHVFLLVECIFKGSNAQNLTKVMMNFIFNVGHLTKVEMHCRLLWFDVDSVNTFQGAWGGVTIQIWNLHVPFLNKDPLYGILMLLFQIF